MRLSQYTHNFLTAPGDYQSITSTLRLSSSLTASDVTVLIINDNIFEATIERFIATLTLVVADNRVTVSPERADVIIIDNDSENEIFFRKQFCTV